MKLIELTLNIRRDVGMVFKAWFRPQLLVAEEARADLNKELKQHWADRNFSAFELICEDWDAPRPAAGHSPPRPWPQFAVFIDDEYDIDWFTDESLKAESFKSVSEAEAIGARRCKHLPNNQLFEFRRLVGLAIVEGIRGSASVSARLSEEAAQFLKARTIERSRSWSQLAAHLLVAVCSVCLWLLWLQGHLLVSQHEKGVLHLALSFQGALFGAYLSVLQKAGKGLGDAASGWWVHLLEVSTKMMAAMVCGSIAFVLTRWMHAPSSIKALGMDGYSLFLFGAGAGLCERLIPKLVSTYVDPDESKKES